MAQKLTKSKKFQILVFQKKKVFDKRIGRKVVKNVFTRARTGSKQTIKIRDRETKEIFDLGIAKTDLKKLKNIGKIIDTAVSNIKDGIWSKLLGRKVEVKKKIDRVSKKKFNELIKQFNSGFIKKLDRFRDQKENLFTSLYEYKTTFDLLQVNEFAKFKGAEFFLYVETYLITFRKTGDTRIFSISSKDVEVTNDIDLIVRIRENMQEQFDEILVFYGESDVEIDLIKTELKLTFRN